MAPANAAATRSGRALLLVVLVAMLLFGATVTGVVIIGVQALRAQARSDDIAACRAAYSVELITGPQSRALEAVARGDEVALQAAVEESNPEEYERLVERSRLDPDGFLRECRAADR